jgi:hypothetical protein
MGQALFAEVAKDFRWICRHFIGTVAVRGAWKARTESRITFITFYMSFM